MQQNPDVVKYPMAIYKPFLECFGLDGWHIFHSLLDVPNTHLRASFGAARHCCTGLIRSFDRPKHTLFMSAMLSFRISLRLCPPGYSVLEAWTLMS